MKKHLQTKVSIAVIIAVALMDINCIFFNYHNYVEANNKYTASLAQTVANTCILVIDGDRVADYLMTNRRDTGYYEVWNKLIDYRNTNTDIIELKVVEFDEAGGHFIFDTDTSDEGAFLGDSYAFDKQQESIRDELIACEKETAIVYANQTNIYVPVKSSYNIPVAYVIVGISTAAQRVENIRYLVWLCIMISGITFLFGLSIILFMHFYVVRHINKMTRAASGYGENLLEDGTVSPLQQVNIRTGDELERLWDSVKKMENDILTSSSSLVIATWNSNHDSMTQLYNKRYYQELLEKQEKKEGNGIIYLDIDNLKKMNDTYGHDKGDEMIIKAAEFIQKYETQDMAGCRIGGDEFVIVLWDSSEEKINDLLERMHQDPDGNLSAGKYEFCCRLAIGGAFQKKGERLSDTIKRAEELMYGDKHSTR